MNVFQYAFSTEENWKRNLEDMTSFRPQYTFYSDFGIAEFYEVLAGATGAGPFSKTTPSFESETWRVKLTELYTDLYYKCVDFIHEKYGKDSDAMSYFYEVTD